MRIANDTTLTTCELDHLHELEAFWKRFHGEQPSLETELLKFLESATQETKALLGRFIKVNDHHMKMHMTAVLDAIENYHGSVSPAEEFVLDCLAGYGARRLHPAGGGKTSNGLPGPPTRRCRRVVDHLTAVSPNQSVTLKCQDDNSDATSSRL